MHNEIECRNKMKAYAQTKLIAMKEHTNKANSFYINYAVSINFPTYIWDAFKNRMKHMWNIWG